MNINLLILCLLLLIPLPIQADTYELFAQPLIRFSTTGHPKSKGLKISIKYPSSWIPEEGERPHIVKKFKKPIDTSLISQMILIYINDLPIETSLLIDSDEILSLDLLKEIASEQGEYIKGGLTKIDGEKAGWFISFVKGEYAGFRTEGFTLNYVIFYKGKLINFLCGVYGLPSEKERLYSEFQNSLPLFQRVMNSVVIESKWEKKLVSYWWLFAIIIIIIALILQFVPFAAPLKIFGRSKKKSLLYSRIEKNHSIPNYTEIYQPINNDTQPTEETYIEEYKYCSICGSKTKKNYYYCVSCGSILMNSTNKPQIEDDLNVSESTKNISYKIHPWRRFFARNIDYTLFAIILFLLLVLETKLLGLQLGKFGKYLLNPFTFTFSLPFYIVYESILLYKFNTTVGKYLFNIFIIKKDNQKLTLEDALKRSLRVLIYGEGLGIPIVVMITRIYALGVLEKNKETSWDKAGNLIVIHYKISIFRTLIIILIYLSILFFFSIIYAYSKYTLF